MRPYIEAVTAPDMPPVQLLGGVGSVALQDEATLIKVDEKRIIAPADLELSNYRDDGNLRDIETLVMSADPDDIARVDHMASQLMGDALQTETFNFAPISHFDPIKAKPLGFKAFMMFVSDRYLPGEVAWSPEGPKARRVLFPFSTAIPHEALETWTLEIGEHTEVPVPAVGAVVLNYLTRSISGLRGKDEEKIEKMATAIFEKAPTTIDWIIDGPGSTQYDFARVLHTLREPKRRPKDLVVGGELTVSPIAGDLARHPMFMLAEDEDQTQQRALRIARFKSRALHAAESVDFAVTAWQRYVEPRIKSVLHNR
jgi:hypothetical protein